MKPSKEIIPSLIMVIAGVIVLTSCFFYLKNGNKEFDALTGFIRIVVALATAAVSIALPGFINLGKPNENGVKQTITPNVTAKGALAVFIIVYLFNPVSL